VMTEKYKKLYKRDILEIVHIFDTDGFIAQ
jgi:hypothetical protein